VVDVDPHYAAVAEAVRRGDRPQALNLAARALKRGVNHPLVLVLAAEGLEERGHAQPAIDLLRAATSAAPGHRVAWIRLAALLARQRRFREAAAAFNAVLDLDPDNYQALIGAGEMSLLLGDVPTAEQRYLRASEVTTGAAAPLAVLAVIAAQRRDVAAARDFAGRAEALEPGLVGAEMALARADLLDGDPALAEARMRRALMRADLDDDKRVGALDIRATALDALDQPAEAFADYAARNEIQRRIHGANFDMDAPERASSIARRQSVYLRQASPAAWRAAPGEDRAGARAVRGHVFLLGFPRSGTTLLEKALSGHPSIIALEEINHLARATLDMPPDESGWRRLENLTEEEADLCRQTYWQCVHESHGADLSDRWLLDKLPLHTLALPHIARLFPTAKILFALRDPRDVVLSCFRQRFQINSAMFEFLTLEGAAGLYDAVMSLAVVARATLALNVREVRHEAVVADFDAEVADILDFIGAGWDPAVRTFADRVGGQARTPSYPQLARGLNADGVGQWRRYQAQLAPILGRLEPWIARFGYPPS